MTVNAAALDALTDIWMQAGGLSVMLPSALALWHCGAISCQADLDDDRALWTTRDPAKQDYYVGWAKEGNRWMTVQAHKCLLTTNRLLRAADFDSASLSAFTTEHCGAMHDRMKVALRAWIIANGFSAAVRLNSDASEVVLTHPRSQATLAQRTLL